MNREIKFRAWDKEKRNMFNIARLDIADGSCYDHLFSRIYDYWNECILMQYTGLKDKNDKEIYEGDIVAERTMGSINYSVVKFGEINISKQACEEKTCICFYNDYSNFNDCWSDEPLNAKKIEVVGNIYENTELLNS